MPSGSILGETALGDQDVQVAIEIQVTAEGVRDHDNHEPDAVFLPSPLLQHVRTQNGQIMQEMPVALEQRPEHIRHGQADVGVGNIG